jgi:hypothetical protein
VCGGTDRFAINVHKQVFNGRVCGAKGDVIALVQHLDDVSFKDAITTLTGDGAGTTPPPKYGSVVRNKGTVRSSREAGSTVVSRLRNHQEGFAQAPIRAELIGSDQCRAEGLGARGYGPVLKLCRNLVAAGFNPARQLEAWRGSTLSLRVRSIGEGAQLTIADDRHGTPRLRRRQEHPEGYVAGSLVAPSADGQEYLPQPEAGGHHSYPTVASHGARRAPQVRKRDGVAKLQSADRAASTGRNGAVAVVTRTGSMKC